MADVPGDLLYTEDHEYLKKTGEAGVYVVGITDYAQGELGDVVYVELPAAGDRFARRDVFGTVEAVKAVSDLYFPVTGEIVEVNESLADDPAQVNNLALTTPPPELARLRTVLDTWIRETGDTVPVKPTESNIVLATGERLPLRRGEAPGVAAGAARINAPGPVRAR